MAYARSKSQKKQMKKDKLYSQYKANKNKTNTVKLIKEVIAKEQETKLVIQNIAVDSNSYITNADMIALLPRLVQDQGEGNAYERVGMKISPRKLKVHCHVGIQDEVNRSLAITVHYFVLQSTIYKNTTSALANVNMGRLLRTGNSIQYKGFEGTIADGMYPINNADFKLLKRGKFNLQKNTGIIQDEITAGNQPLVGPVCKDWVFDLEAPAKLTYEQDNNSPRVVYYPNGYAPFIVFGYTHQDGSDPDGINQDIAVSVSSHLYYDDA